MVGWLVGTLALQLHWPTVAHPPGWAERHFHQNTPETAVLGPVVTPTYVKGAGWLATLLADPDEVHP